MLHKTVCLLELSVNGPISPALPWRWILENLEHGFRPVPAPSVRPMEVAIVVTVLVVVILVLLVLHEANVEADYSLPPEHRKDHSRNKRRRYRQR